MSFRFRRTLKIAPGLRLNLGKTGVSLSAGVRGARVTFGSKRGTTATVGLPGSGLHYTTTLSSSRHASVDAEYLTKKELRVLTYNLAQAEIESEKENFGEFLCLVQKTPQLLPKEKWEEELLQRPFTLALYGESKAFLEEFKSKAKVKNWDALIESWKTKVLIFPLVLLIVYQMFFENPTNHYLPYAVLGFYFLQASTVAWWVYIWWIDRKQALASAVVEYETITRQHKELQEKHPSVEAQRIEHLRKLIAADEEVLVEVLEERLCDLQEEFADMAHPFDISASVDVPDNHTVLLDLDLPEIEDVVPSITKRALKSGEISCKEKTQKLQHQEYVKGVVGLAYVVAANIFNSSPSIKNAVVSGYTQRRNKKTGQMEDQYVYSVCFNVDKFRVLNFQYIDPLEALTNFSFRIDERSNGELKAIAPFGTSDLKSVA